MDHETAHLITKLLGAIGRGDSGRARQLYTIVYDELRHMAVSQMAQELGRRTLQPTALVHEAYLRLTAAGEGTFENRRHFFAAAARAMQEIRVDDARRRGRLKRGGDRRIAPLQDEPSIFDQDSDEVLDLSAALGRLEEQHPELAEVVRHRYFVGLTVEEAAEVLGVAARTVRNRWNLARAWLYNALRGE